MLNKCDEPSTERSYHQLRATLGLARPLDGTVVPVFKTSAKTGIGIPELVASLAETLAAGAPRDRNDQETLFFERWVREEWGRSGTRFLRGALDGARTYVQTSGGIEPAQLAFERKYRQGLTG